MSARGDLFAAASLAFVILVCVLVDVTTTLGVAGAVPLPQVIVQLSVLWHGHDDVHGDKVRPHYGHTQPYWICDL